MPQGNAALGKNRVSMLSFENTYPKNQKGDVSMTDNIFREYDIRGIVGKQIKLGKISQLTKAILTYFLRKDKSLKNIIVAMDGRTHSPEIKKKVIKAATEMGINVTVIGICPTPVFYFSLFNKPIKNGSLITSGIMITASHNPKEYNGFKICFEKKSVWGKEIQEIKKIYKSGNFGPRSPRVRSVCAGKITFRNVLGEYIEWMKIHFSHLKNLNINAVIDCGNGTAGTVFPKLIKEMGWKNVKLLYEKVDGNFPNHEANPTTPKNMLTVKNMLQEDETLEVGLGLDGDSDRMNPMTKSGYLVPGDQLLALYTKKIMVNHKKTTPVKVVFDIKSSAGLIEALESYGAIPHIAPSGHSIIKEHLYQTKAKLAGEISCHFFFNDRYFGYDDGIYAALRLFELLYETKQNLDELIATLPKKVSSPEYRIECSDENKNLIVEHAKKIFAARSDVELLTIDGARATMKEGWGLIRASNTQPAICLRFESETIDGLKKIESEFINALKPYFSKKFLQEYFCEEYRDSSANKK
jgi:phosphomannomutase/phosphoglucomutase